MSTIDLGNNPVGSTPTDEQKTQLRSSIGLGSNDVVEFGELATSQLNFPNLTTSEINAVTDATEGDTYFDSDRGQFIRFTGPASYDVVSTRQYTQDSSLTTSAPISLAAARFFESGLVSVSPDVFTAEATLRVFANDAFGDGTADAYIYHDGSSGFVGQGWVDVNNPFGGNVTGDVVVSGKPYSLFIRSSGSKTAFSFNTIVASDTTNQSLTNVPLQGGSSYEIKVTAPISDLAEGNLRFDFGYTGVYTDATIEVICDDILQNQRSLQLKGKLVENDVMSFASGTKLATPSPKIGIYTFNMIIKPSSDGVFTLSARQTVSNADPLLIDTVQTSVSALSS